MVIIKELKKIAGLNEKIKRLSDILEEKVDVDGLHLKNAYLISGCSVKGNHLYRGIHRLDNCGLVDDLYYCKQHSGWCEDDFYGTLYFKTDVPGQYVAVPFEM